MIVRGVVFYSVLCCVVLSSAYAEEKASAIDWKIFYIQAIYNKPGTGAGYADELFRYYREHLPEYEHAIEGMPIKRIFHDMANITEGLYCCPGKTPLSDELMGKVISSNSAMELAPPGIVVRASDIGTIFPDKQPVSVEELLVNKGLRTSWVRGATYHPTIRGIVEQNEQLPNVTMQATVTGEFQEMLLRGHIDFYVSHALDYTWHYKNTPLVEEKLRFLPVVEAPSTVSTLAMCNDTPEGREVIEKINKMVETEEFRIFREDLIRRYYPPDMIEEYIQLHLGELPKYTRP